jgi:4-hydroxy-tetrahydrodipicolinate synthase
MEATTTLRLAYDFPNIVAIKEASGKLDQITMILRGAPEGFVVYSGDDEATLPIMSLGGYGVISTIGNLLPTEMKQLVDLLAAGEHAKALELHLRLQPLMRELFITANPIMLKEAMKLIGFDCGGVRLPLIDATKEQSDGLRQVMQATGALS